MKNLKKLAVVAAGAVASAGAFAQATGTTGVDVTSTVSSISAVSTSIVAIGGAVLGIVVVAWGYRVVKGFLGR
ncbi:MULTISPECIES: major capsid protein [Burkholderia cepacia complex]|uniref:major capsid protein n=1 Tax=Burkholderia cepacia complex TaxID=87882 RepID=UPI00075377BD|nr:MULTISPECIES: major capsid protein [Burkholderia cepacia complex]KVF68936.1 coat protein [Burkholderia vietnamiensis]KVL92055.1 coat protein [Burkholderia stagnalis]KVL97645.1 coat protein [Burkholderia stagnalis]KVM11702.1 coat protein [Burkholderia stagnalis]